jgi:hypothetical protein
MESKMKHNHDFIFALVELYSQLPDVTPQDAAERVAILVEMEMAEMEAKGETITREALLEKFKAAIQQHLNSAA